MVYGKQYYRCCPKKVTINRKVRKSTAAKKLTLNSSICKQHQ